MGRASPCWPRSSWPVANLEDLYADPRPYQGQEICTEGLMQEWFPHMILVPRRFTDEEALLMRIAYDIMYIYQQNIIDGDRVRVRGELSFPEDCYDFYIAREWDWSEESRICIPKVPLYLEPISIERVRPQS